MASEYRARLTTKGNYGNESFRGPSSILSKTKGVVFPYTPVINYSHNVNYSEYELMHTNYAINSFVNSRPGNISITAQFVNQTVDEAKYTFGVIHFLRIVTKMNFGNNSNNPGTPPPVLEFSAYGTSNFNRVPVLVGSFSTSYGNDVDYSSFKIDDQTEIRLPIKMEFSIELMPQYSARKQNNFDFEKFAQGNSYKDGYI
ncbi:MAG: hypothetical protein ACOCT9_02040 [archaeon]